MALFKNKLTGVSTELAEKVEALAALQAEFDSLNESFASVQEEVKNLTEVNATLQSEFARVSEENKALQSQVEGLNVEIAETTVEAVDFEERAAFKASEIVATLGVEPVEADDADDSLDLMATFKGLKGKAQAEFFNQNKKEIFKTLGK